MEDQEEWKIWPPYEIFYIESLLTKTKTIIADYEHLDRVTKDQGLFEQNPLILIDLAENIVNQAAAISRYLFPSRQNGPKNKIHKLRGEKLRESLEVNDDNILTNRNVRT